MISGYFQHNKIERLKNELLLKEVNEGQKQIIVEYIPMKIKKEFPEAKDKEGVGNKLYGGEP